MAKQGQISKTEYGKYKTGHTGHTVHTPDEV
jgi:hypothetical protein